MNDLEQLVQGKGVSIVLQRWISVQDSEPIACSGNPTTEEKPKERGMEGEGETGERENVKVIVFG